MDTFTSDLLLTNDIGNTNIALGLFDEKQLVANYRVATDQDNLADEYAILLLGLLSSSQIDPDRIKSAIMSSTVPALLKTFSEICHRYFDARVMVVGPGIKTGVPILYDNPREVGPDRILHAVAALDKYAPPLIIVDLGTACVFDAISEHGEYLGGAIAPGIGLAAKALFDSAAMLNSVSLERPDGPIGRNSVHSMQAGIFFGYAEMVRGMVSRFSEELADNTENTTVIGTGDYINILADEVGCFDHLEANLNLDGLRLVYAANR